MKSAFTLIELLVVITIIAILSGLSFPVLRSVKRGQYISTTRAEMSQIEAAIDSYKAANGYYPPGAGSNQINQLYYELKGMTNTGTTYVMIDGSTQITASDLSAAFPGVGGFANCSKPGGDNESTHAKNFVGELKPQQTATIRAGGVWVTNLVASVGGPDKTYQPLGQPNVNPWRYTVPGAHNPNGYDLWVYLSISSKTNLVCNWRN